MTYQLLTVELSKESQHLAVLGGEGPFFRSYLLYLGHKDGGWQLDILWFHGIRHAILAMFPNLTAPHKPWCDHK